MSQNPAPFFYDDALMGYNMGANHPMKPIRLQMTYELLKSYGVFGEHLELISPKPASRELVEKVHSSAYLDMVEQLDSGDYIRGAEKFGFATGDNPIFAGMNRAAYLYTGATVQAAEAVLNGAKVAFSIAGGLHHAHHAQASGFCVFNDCAVALAVLKERLGRVAYVDIDVHHGDGVQWLFYDDPNVLTVSLHQTGYTLFPGTGHVDEIGDGDGIYASINVPYAANTDDSIWLSAWRATALPLLKAYQPRAIVLQMGADAHHTDPLANLKLTAQGWLEAVKDVKALEVPIVAIGGGGYDLANVPRMWTSAVTTLAGIAIPDEVPETYPFRKQVPATLSDPNPPRIRDRDRLNAVTFADQTIAALKARLFPHYGIPMS